MKMGIVCLNLSDANHLYFICSKHNSFARIISWSVVTTSNIIHNRDNPIADAPVVKLGNSKLLKTKNKIKYGAAKSNTEKTCHRRTS
jgi:hypothetical protein